MARGLDIDGVPLAEAHEWAQARADADSAIAIALRSVDERGRPGLIWLVEDPVISGDSNGGGTPALASGHDLSGGAVAHAGDLPSDSE